MLGKIAGAIIGQKMAGRTGNGARGALFGAGIAALARRGIGPLGTALALGYGAKKLYEWNRSRRAPAYPSADAPVAPPVGASSLPVGASPPPSGPPATSL